MVGSSLNLFERDDDEPQILVNGEGAWEDVEFEVVLDSGSIVNVCHPDDCPGYTIGESSGSKRGQNFVLETEGSLPTWASGTSTWGRRVNVAKTRRPPYSRWRR